MIAINKKLLGKVATDYIVERGENDNGYYEKWNSGLLRQWGKLTVTSECKTSSGSLYRTESSQEINFPVPFTDIPTVNVQAQAAFNSAYIVDPTETKAYAFPLSTVQLSSYARYIHWQAVGKWN